MGNRQCRRGCRFYKEEESENEDDTVKEATPIQDVEDVSKMDSYSKLFTWMIQMTESDDTDSDNLEIFEKFKRTHSADSRQHGQFLFPGANSDSFDSHGSSETPYWSSTFKSSISEDIPEEEEDGNEGISKNSSFDLIDSRDDFLQVPKRRGVLVKQRSVCDSQYGVTDSPERHMSTRTLYVPGDPVTDHKIRELNMLRARLQDLQFKKSRQRPEFVKQKSESYVERIYKHDHTFLKRKRNAARSCENIDERNESISKFPSRQTTFSDEEYNVLPCGASGRNYDNEGTSELIRLHEFSSLQADSDFSDFEVNSSKNRKNSIKGKISNFWSKSVGNLFNRNVRMRSRMDRKSNSLFTVQPSIDSNFSKMNIESGSGCSEKVLDNKLLDGNIADILYAVDAIWPKNQ